MNQIDRYTCEQVFQRLDDFIDRELSPAEMALVESHIETCAWCARTYKFEAEVLRGVRSRLKRFAAPPDLLARVSAALDEAERE